MSRTRCGDVLFVIVWIGCVLGAPTVSEARAVPHHRQRGEGIRRLHNVTLDSRNSNLTAGSTSGELVLEGCQVNHFGVELFGLLGTRTGSLSLRGGHIPRITYASPTLDTLVVDETGLYEFEVNSSYPVASLRILQITRNPLEQLSPGLARFSGLHRLDLSRNQLTSVELGLFNGMSRLRDLDLSVNRIVWLGFVPPATARLASIRNLWVSYNRLQRFDEFPAAFPGLDTVRLLGNQWTCRWVDRARLDIMRHGITVFGADYDCPGARQGGLCCYEGDDDVTEDAASSVVLAETTPAHRTNRSDGIVGVRYGEVEVFL
uniref:Putative leucine-rich repeat protein n=1 Tax=Anopheles triannulatus TaxID=58253 RepID=A0A2M4ANC3_9DIPT